ncbi:hypothetical protein SDC49_26010 [Lactobacillus sp. R2/2]|nr:hypothetical protein [Lactobacillus sp. R2/2]
MFYDRSVLGLWVTGQGVVYSDFDAKIMLIEHEKFLLILLIIVALTGALLKGTMA